MGVIFDAPDIRAILDGRRTECRRLLDYREPHYADRARKANGEPRRGASRALVLPFDPRPGDLLPFSRPARRQDEESAKVGTLIVTNVRTEQLAAVDYAGARAEGHRTTDEFRAIWVRRHDPGWWEARIAPHDPDDALEALVLGRFLSRWGPRYVTVISFIVDRTAPPRLLADRNAATDYVESAGRALAGEPEAVSDAWLERFAKDSWERHESSRDPAEEARRKARELRGWAA